MSRTLSRQPQQDVNLTTTLNQAVRSKGQLQGNAAAVSVEHGAIVWFRKPPCGPSSQRFGSAF